jgi:hypothetical protein
LFAVSWLEPQTGHLTSVASFMMRIVLKWFVTGRALCRLGIGIPSSHNRC